MKILSLIHTLPKQNITNTLKADDLNFIQENIIGLSNNEIDTFMSSAAEDVFENTTYGISNIIQWFHNTFE